MSQTSHAQMFLVAALTHDYRYRYNNITCAEGLYDLLKKDCVTVKECEAYGSDIMRTKSCECVSGQHTIS